MIRKRIRSILLLMVCSGILAWCTWWWGIQQTAWDVEKNLPQACFDEVCYTIEIADSAEERQRGLMWREQMDVQAGMLFIFPTSAPWRTFWMKNTYIPLDIIWLDSAYTVVYQEEHVPPCTTPSCPSYGPQEEISQYVLELNAGQISRLASEVGDIITIHMQ